MRSGSVPKAFRAPSLTGKAFQKRSERPYLIGSVPRTFQGELNPARNAFGPPRLDTGLERLAVASRSSGASAPNPGGPRRMDVSPIIKIFDSLITAGSGQHECHRVVCTVGRLLCISAGGGVRAVESAKRGLYISLFDFAVAILCTLIAILLGGALSAPGAGTCMTSTALCLIARLLT
jgi:hypothetical protein